MDMWVVAAAAAAAGYVGKYWQNLSRNRDSLPSMDSGSEKCESSSYGRLTQGKKLDKNVVIDRGKLFDQRFSEFCELNGVAVAEVASSSDHHDVFAQSTISPEFLSSNDIKGNQFGSGCSGDNPIDLRIEGMSSMYVSARKSRPLRTKYSFKHTLKPLTSLESCLVAQLYQKHREMEEYVLNSRPSPYARTIRPFFITDGRRIISRASGEFQSARRRNEVDKMHKEACMENVETVLGVPPLPEVGSLNWSEEVKFKSGKRRLRRLSCSSKFGDGSNLPLLGSQDATGLFCLGISIGILSSLSANKREVDKLKEYLKQTENLVQDLQEELEMKDSLTVRELANETYGSQGTFDNSFCDNEPKPFFPDINTDNPIRLDDEEFCDEKTDSESMSKIEAELEAELERMGLNINVPSLERRLSDFVELDPDFEADFAQGDLRSDMVEKPISDQQSETCETPIRNNAVSPRELSLRLHEVIESRLEKRVMELEAALAISKKKLQLLESKEHDHSWKSISGYSSCEENHMAKDYNSMAEPLVMNLSGQALDAYNEAYEEFMKNNESEEEDSPSEVPPGESVTWSQNAKVNGFLSHCTQNTEEKTWGKFYPSLGRTSEHSLKVEELIDVGASGDENSDSDELEKQLIKQIVEKTTKQGSPAVLNAQRVLFLMDNDEPLS